MTNHPCRPYGLRHSTTYSDLIERFLSFQGSFNLILILILSLCPPLFLFLPLPSLHFYIPLFFFTLFINLPPDSSAKFNTLRIRGPLLGRPLLSTIAV
ncbi:hypothetical protein BDW59DRAFT_111174 [Aspergillus cavernicola]|uniref:Uncharacterized protein n=1 Tax=Aspergillus cavernicola TaxID=176166 RepID=A0ABR4I0H6_9EURO